MKLKKLTYKVVISNEEKAQHIYMEAIIWRLENYGYCVIQTRKSIKDFAEKIIKKIEKEYYKIKISTWKNKDIKQGDYLRYKITGEPLVSIN